MRFDVLVVERGEEIKDEDGYVPSRSPLEQFDGFITDEGALDLDAVDDLRLSARGTCHDGRVKLPATIQHNDRSMTCHLSHSHQQAMTRLSRQYEQIPLVMVKIKEFIHVPRIQRETKIKNPRTVVSVGG